MLITTASDCGRMLVTHRPMRDTSQPTLSERATRGFAILIVQTLGTKAVNTFMQLALAWLLLPEDFGLVAMAVTVSSLVAALSKPGTQVVLVQRHRRFDRWANPAFWMSLCYGLAGAVVAALLAPAAGAFYGRDVVTRLVLILAIAIPLDPIRIVPAARLQADMRFRFISKVTIATATFQALLSIALAWFGFGPFSFVIPIPVAELLRTVLYWAATRPAVQLNPQWRRWRFLLGDVWLVTVGDILQWVPKQCDYLILALVSSADVVGQYFFSFQLARQTATLLTTNLNAVLFPALSQLSRDPHRQVQAYLRSAKLVAVVAVPAALLQAAMVEPAVRLVLDKQWQPIVPVLQLLSIAAAVRVIGAMPGSLIQAQRRFALRLVVHTVYAVTFLTSISIGAVLGEAIGVAVAVIAYQAVLGPAFLYVAIRPFGRGWRDIAGVYTWPFIVGGLASLVAAQIPRLLPGLSPLMLMIQLVATAILGTTLAIVGMRLVQRAACRDLWSRLQSLRNRNTTNAQ